jgi:hypothetical protein
MTDYRERADQYAFYGTAQDDQPKRSYEGAFGVVGDSLEV